VKVDVEMPLGVHFHQRQPGWLLPRQGHSNGKERDLFELGYATRRHWGAGL
jgi:hypothetical protein